MPFASAVHDACTTRGYYPTRMPLNRLRPAPLLTLSLLALLESNFPRKSLRIPYVPGNSTPLDKNVARAKHSQIHNPMRLPSNTYHRRCGVGRSSSYICSGCGPRTRRSCVALWRCTLVPSAQNHARGEMRRKRKKLHKTTIPSHSLGQPSGVLPEMWDRSRKRILQRRAYQDAFCV